MNKILYLIISILLCIDANSQEKKPKYLDINLSHSLYSFDNYSYKISHKTHRHDYFSSFSPKLGLEYSFGKSTKFKHSVLFSYYTYTQTLSLDVPELFITSDYNNNSTVVCSLQDAEVVRFFDHFKYSAYSIEYRFSYYLNNRIDFNFKMGLEKFNLDNHGTYNINIYNSISDSSKAQRYKIQKLHNSRKFAHSILTSFGVNYKINDNFQLLFSIDSKPFGNIIEELDIKYNDTEVDELYLDLYHRYINLSLGLKYRIKISKDKN